MRKIYLIVILLGGFTILKAQSSLSFYHLGDATFQNSSMNPAYMPNGRVFIGLPVISGVHVNVNNKFSYNQAFKKEGNNNVVSIGGLLSELQTNNMFSGNVNVNLLHLGYRLRTGPAFSLFANERIESDILYPKQLLEFVWNGSGSTLGDVVDLSGTGMNVSHFREIGVGVAHRVSNNLRVGARLKMYQGFLNISTPRNLTANIEVNPQTYAWKVETENAVLRSAGKHIYSGDEGNLGQHLTGSGNSGFGVDLGFEYDVNKYLSFAGSIVDFGFINWKTDVENKQFSDTTFTYAGVNIKDIDNLQQSLQDSLFSKFKTTKNSDPYKTWVPTKLYGSMIWKYTDNTHFIGTVGARYIHGQMKMLYGGGVKQKFGPITASLNAVKLPQHFFNLGAAFAVRGGPVQYYLAADQIVSFSVPDAKAFDIRMGLNIIIGHSGGSGGSSASSTFDSSRLRGGDAKGVSSNSFLGERVKSKGREGIYGVIEKQNKRDVPESKKPPRKSKKEKIRARTSKKSKQKYPSKRKRY